MSSSTYSFVFNPGLIPGYIQSILTAFPMTVYLLIYSLIFGLIIGFVVTLMQIKGNHITAKIAHGYISLMRGIPSLVLIFLLFMGIPQLFPQYANTPKSTFIVIAMSLISSANLGEMMRSSYLAVDRGQTEAALSIGMTERQALIHIVLPQAIAIAVPNFGNNIIGIFKETSLAFSIGLLDLMGKAQAISAANFGVSRLEIYIAVAVIYWAICLILQLATVLVERATSQGRALAQ